MLFVIIAPVSLAHAEGKSIPVNWQVAGSIANYLLTMTAPPDPSSTIPHYLISLSAKGPPGPAEITLMGYGFPVDPTGSGCDQLIIIFNNEMVARFSDLSLLFAVHDTVNGGYLCITAGATSFNTSMVITGGTGRFEGATGGFTGTGSGYPVNPDPSTDGPLSAETGELTGTINLP